MRRTLTTIISASVSVTLSAQPRTSRTNTFLLPSRYALIDSAVQRTCNELISSHLISLFVCDIDQLQLEFFFSSVADADGRERTPSQVQRIGLGVCTTCNKNITANDQVVNVAGGLVHWDCLRCDRCGRPFNNRRNCVIQDGVCSSLTLARSPSHALTH